MVVANRLGDLPSCDFSHHVAVQLELEVAFGSVSRRSISPRCILLATHGRSIQMCHVWTAPSWQEFSSRMQHWSVQPCVRPCSAVHTTAGHNAFRGSGPGQKDAFDNAAAQVGCPDRRIDRLCITCCSLLPTFTSRWMSG